MTTNVFDRITGVLASDSRWSGSINEYLFYVDNVGYEKIVFDSKIALLFAGDLNIIDQWKIWFYGSRYAPKPPTSGRLSLCLVDLNSGNVPIDHGMRLDSQCSSARFAGTGSPHALNCWVQNKDAIKSVNTACGLDLQSGGNVVYLNRFDRSNNLSNSVSASQLTGAFLTHGEMIMINATNKQSPIPISEAIKDPAANDAYIKMMSGGVSGICAPFIGMGTAWTPEEEKELHDVLDSYRTE